MKKFIYVVLLISLTASADGQPLTSFIEKGKVGFKNVAGTIVIPATYEASAAEFSEGFVAVRLNGKMGFIDTTGKVIVPFKYDEVDKFSGGLVRVYIAAGEKYGIIDKNGKEIVPVKFDFVDEEFRHNLINVRVNGHCAVYNKKGEKLIDLPYEYCRAISPDLVVVTSKEKKSGLFEIKSSGIDVKTKKPLHLQLLPVKYDPFLGITWFTDSLLQIHLNDKMGLAKPNGMVLLQPEYEVIAPFKNGKAEVFKNGERSFFIDTEGKRIF
jgi:WG containing repeat